MEDRTKINVTDLFSGDNFKDSFLNERRDATTAILEKAKLKKEENILEKIKHPGIVEITNFDNKTGSIEIDGVMYKTLSKFVEEAVFELEDSCNLGLALIDILDHLWNQGIIYNNINPDSVLISKNKKEVKLINFKLSSDTTVDYATENQLHKLEGNIHFISPEQSGRMNRITDFRSDIYSLGALLYYALSGETLFKETKVNEIIHAHLTRTIKPIHEKITDFSIFYSNVITKMLDKNAEGRYQSSFGLKKDIELVVETRRTNSSDYHLKVGDQDYLGQFEISQKLYGRDKQIIKVLESYDQITNGKSKLLLVNGYSGIGKTALVNEVKKPITEHNGSFVSGKFDQLKKNIPFFGLSQALSKLVEQILLEDEKTIEKWRYLLMNEFHDNLQIICEIIPKVEKLVGPQDKITFERTSSETQNIFYKTLKDFIDLFKSPDSPLVLFLDDLQWADESTIGLIKYIFSDQKDDNLLLIAGYRNNEVGTNHPLQLVINDLTDLGSNINEIALKNLPYEDVQKLVADTLNKDISSATFLADLIYQKAKGNPFFTRNLLKTLHQRGLIYFDERLAHWLWKEDEILALPISDNLLELLIENVKELSPKELKVLQYASIIGSSFKSNITLNSIRIITR